MIPKKPAPDVIRGGHRFAEKIMLKTKTKRQRLACVPKIQSHNGLLTPKFTSSLRK
jgi:hypothetical protein